MRFASRWLASATHEVETLRLRAAASMPEDMPPSRDTPPLPASMHEHALTIQRPTC